MVISEACGHLFSVSLCSSKQGIIETGRSGTRMGSLQNPTFVRVCTATMHLDIQSELHLWNLLSEFTWELRTARCGRQGNDDETTKPREYIEGLEATERSRLILWARSVLIFLA